MSSFLRFLQFVLGTANHHFMSVLNKMVDDVFYVKLLRSAVYQRNIVYAEGSLQRGIFVQKVQYYVRDRIVLQFVNDTHTSAVGFITDFIDTRNFFLLHEFRCTGNHFSLIYLVRYFGDDNSVPVVNFFEIHFSPNHNTSAAGVQSVTHTVVTINNTSCGKIRRYDVLHKLIYSDLTFVYIRTAGIYRFRKVVRRHIGGHTHGNTARTVDQEIRNSGRHYGRFRKTVIEVILEI